MLMHQQKLQKVDNDRDDKVLSVLHAICWNYGLSQIDDGYLLGCAIDAHIKVTHKQYEIIIWKSSNKLEKKPLFETTV
jgi:hypothetical protein